MSKTKKIKDDKLIYRVTGYYTIQTVTIENGKRNIQIEYINQN
jgi:hypothetical protein